MSVTKELIVVKDLHKNFGDIEVLKGIQSIAIEIINKDQIFTNICDIEKCKDCEYKDICNNNCMCRFCYHKVHIFF